MYNIFNNIGIFMNCVMSSTQMVKIFRKIMSLFWIINNVLKVSVLVQICISL